MPAGNNRFQYVFFILLLCTGIAFAFDLGIGGGVASYPGTLDPYTLLDHVPILYPRIEFSIPVIQKWQVRCSAQRSVYGANVYGCFCIQSLTMNTLSLGLSLRLGTKEDFSIGVDGLYGFSVYDHAGLPINTNNYGVKIHLSAQQPLWRDLSYTLRTGVQQERVLGKDDLPEIDMTIFSVECMVLLGL